MQEASFQSSTQVWGGQRLAERDLPEIVDLVAPHDEHGAERAVLRVVPAE